MDEKMYVAETECLKSIAKLKSERPGAFLGYSGGVRVEYGLQLLHHHHKL